MTWARWSIEIFLLVFDLLDIYSVKKEGGNVSLPLPTNCCSRIVTPLTVIFINPSVRLAGLIPEGHNFKFFYNGKSHF